MEETKIQNQMTSGVQEPSLIQPQQGPKLETWLQKKGTSHKKKVFFAVLSIFLVIGVSLGAFYVTNELNKKETPNAPSKSKASEACSAKYYFDKTLNTCVATSSTYTSGMIACGGSATCAQNLAAYVDGNGRPTGGVCFDSAEACTSANTCAPMYYIDKNSSSCRTTSSSYNGQQLDCAPPNGKCSDNIKTYLDAAGKPTTGVCYASDAECKVALASLTSVGIGGEEQTSCTVKYYVDRTTNTCKTTSSKYNSQKKECTSAGVGNDCSFNLKEYVDKAGKLTGGICYDSSAECQAEITRTANCSQKYYLDINSNRCVQTSSPYGYGADGNECGANNAPCWYNLLTYRDNMGVPSGAHCFDSQAACEATATNGAKPGPADNTFSCTQQIASSRPACEGPAEASGQRWGDNYCIFMVCPKGDTNKDGSCGVQDEGYQVRGAGDCFKTILPRAHRLPPDMCYQVDGVVSSTNHTWCSVNTPCTNYEANMRNCYGATTPTATPTVACTDTTWTPATNTVCEGDSFSQTSNCGNKRNATGTKTDGSCASCTDTTWSPAVNTVCAGDTFSQTSNCGTKRNATGTKNCDSCTDTTWSPAVNTVCAGDTFSQTSNCGARRSATGTKVCGTSDLSIEKRVYEDESDNTSAKYNLRDEVDTVSRNQTVVYTFIISNTGSAAASNIKVVDVLTGNNQELLTYLDGDSGCSYATSTRTVTCSGMSLDVDKEKTYSFRVRVSDSAENGQTIRNLGVMSYKEMPTDGEQEAVAEVKVSTVVGCSVKCTRDSECSSGLTCDTSTGSCRKPSCADATNCTCPLPTREVTDAPDAPSTPTTTRRMSQTTPRPTELVEAGILDFPGVAAFGGGLLLAVIGILLAL